jgi:hypothetical protein
MITQKLFVASAIVVLFTSQTFAQKESSATYKNEFGVHVGPLASVALGGDFFASPVGLVYKRVRGDWAFRANFDYLNLSDYSENYKRKMISDSLFTTRNSRYTNHTFNVGLGAEYRFKIYKGLVFTAGGDIITVVLNERRNIDEMRFRIDSITQPQSAEPTVFSTSIGVSNLLNERINTTHFGLSTSIGLLVPIGERFWLSANYKTYYVVGPTRVVSNDNVAGKKQDYTVTRFNFFSSPGISEITLFYRF